MKQKNDFDIFINLYIILYTDNLEMIDLLNKLYLNTSVCTEELKNKIDELKRRNDLILRILSTNFKPNTTKEYLKHLKSIFEEV